MRKLFKRRPSAGSSSAFWRWCLPSAAVYAAKKAKVTYKGLDKDARLKVLPAGKTNANTGSTPVTRPAPGPSPTAPHLGRRFDGVPLSLHGIFDGTFSTAGIAARGDRRLEADNNPINGTTIKVEATTSGANHDGDGYGINIVTTPLGGQHPLGCMQRDGRRRPEGRAVPALGDFGSLTGAERD